MLWIRKLSEISVNTSEGSVGSHQYTRSCWTSIYISTKACESAWHVNLSRAGLPLRRSSRCCPSLAPLPMLSQAADRESSQPTFGPLMSLSYVNGSKLTAKRSWKRSIDARVGPSRPSMDKPIVLQDVPIFKSGIQACRMDCNQANRGERTRDGLRSLFGRQHG